MAKKAPEPEPFTGDGDGDPCPYCKDWHDGHETCPFIALSPDAPEVPVLLRSVVFADRSDPAPLGAKHLKPHVTRDVKVNDYGEVSSVVCATMPIQVEAGGGGPTVLSMGVLAEAIQFGPEEGRIRIAGLDVLAPMGLDDPESDRYWSTDDAWTRVWLYVEHVEFALR